MRIIALVSNNKTFAAQEADFAVQNEGSIVLVRPLNESAREHVEGNVQADAQWFGGALVVEHRFAADLLQALYNEGFVLS